MTKTDQPLSWYEYKLLHSSDAQALSAEVSSYLADGWQTCEGPTVCINAYVITFAQAVVKIRYKKD